MAMKVEQKYIDAANEMLERIVEDHIDEDGKWSYCEQESFDIGIAGELFPQIYIYRDARKSDPDNSVLSGSGILILAFLLQEGALADDSKCASCAKKKSCFTINHVKCRSERTVAEDYLDFLRQKYPGLYIPKYKSKDTKFGWIDLLVDYIHPGNGWFNPHIGVPSPPECSRYEAATTKPE